MAKAKKVAKRRPASLVRPTTEQASRIVKRAAARQRIVISLSEEQFEELVRNFRPQGGRSFDPQRPFEIDFQCGSVGRSRLPVASCAFWSDTCCV